MTWTSFSTVEQLREGAVGFGNGVFLRDGEAPASHDFGSVGLVPAQQQQGRAEVRERERQPFSKQVAVQLADERERRPLRIET